VHHVWHNFVWGWLIYAPSILLFVTEDPIALKFPATAPALQEKFAEEQKQENCAYEKCRADDEPITNGFFLL